MKTTYSELIKFSRFRKRIDDLRDRLSSDPEAVVPWVGAGMSARYGMPLWSTFVGELIAKMPQDDRFAADHLRTNGFYDLAADFAYVRLGRTEFESLMVQSFNRKFDPMAPHPIARLHPRMVVTTNYDRVIDQTMPWLLPLLPHTFRLNAFRDEDVLLKLHGTVETPDSWVLTRFQYATAYKEGLWSELRELFANRTVLFIGCSLGTDMFLDSLRKLPPGRSPRHYAILSVASNAEATARGLELERLGIAIIPYIADDGDHTIVERILEEVRPALQKTLSYADRLRMSGNLDRAMRVLSVQAIGVADVLARTQIAVKMAEVLQSYRVANPDRSTWATDFVVRFAHEAAGLGPASEMVIGIAVDVLNFAGRRDPELELRLRDLQRPTASGSVSATTDQDVRDAYSNLRGGHAAALLDQIERIGRRGDNVGDNAERLGILRIRSLLAIHADDQAILAIEKLPHSIRPFGDALIHFASNTLGDTLTALNELDSRWRASSQNSGRPGLVFSLSLRTLAHLGLTDYGAAADTASRVIAAHDPNSRKAERLFRKGVPSELCYDVRRLGSSELLAILHCIEWIARAALRNDTDEHTLVNLRDLVRRLEREKPVDRLLRWYWVLFAQLLPDSATQQGELQRTFNELMRETTDESGGMFGEVALLFRVASRTAFRDSIPTSQIAALALK